MDVFHSLTLAQIAAWQVSHPPATAGGVVAALPALQRGAIWKVKQIEELWDSILRRFPIGSFVIAPPDEKRGRQQFKLANGHEDLPDPTHLLLDGQQRATGIALGFDDVWRPDRDATKVKSAFWIDLAEAPASRDATFAFRVITRAHPWGYNRINPEDRLSERQIRAAIKAFQACSPKYATSRPEDIPLTATWPWDAEAPVPVAIIIAALTEHPGDLMAAKKTAWMRISLLPLFAKPCIPEQDPEEEKAITAARLQLGKQTSNISDAFLESNSVLAHRLDQILQKLAAALTESTAFRVPLLHVDLNDDASENTGTVQAAPSEPLPAEDEGAKKDPIELLFVRINSAGTPLAGEELIYSLLKSAWTEAPSFIEALAHKPALPSRIAMFCIRLVLARRQALTSHDNDKVRYAVPPALAVDEFRRLVRNLNPAHPAFLNTLEAFIKNDAEPLFAEAWLFLTDEQKPFALPPVLAVKLAQGTPEVFFLLLRWLDRLRELKINTSDVGKARHRRSIGFLTALAWFALDKEKAVAVLWSDMQTETSGQKILDFFNKTRFADACGVDERGRMRMVPLPSADELELVCKKRITGYSGCQVTITKSDSAIWYDWEWENCFVSALAKELGSQFTEKLRSKALINSDEVDFSESALAACRHFANTLWGSREILLYAQRNWLTKWFPKFDPSLPEYMEDKNRPWDYDHIHPQNFLRSPQGNTLQGIPRVIRDWHSSIGNLRAWPLEANRADGDSSPKDKLTDVSTEEARYSINSKADVLKASFVRDEWDWWRECVPTDGQRDYLKRSEYHAARRAMMMAIITRFVALYRTWYDTLQVDSLQN